MKVTVDYRAFIIEVLSFINPYLDFKEGAEKSEIIYSPSKRLDKIVRLIGFAPIVLPKNVEFEEKEKLLTWDIGDNDFKIFRLREEE